MILSPAQLLHTNQSCNLCLKLTVCLMICTSSIIFQRNDIYQISLHIFSGTKETHLRGSPFVRALSKAWVLFFTRQSWRVIPARGPTVSLSYQVIPKMLSTSETRYPQLPPYQQMTHSNVFHLEHILELLYPILHTRLKQLSPESQWSKVPIPSEFASPSENGLRA